MLEYVQDSTLKKKFLIKFEDVQKREMISISLLYVCSKEEVCLEIDAPLSGLTQKLKKVNC